MITNTSCLREARSLYMVMALLILIAAGGCSGRRSQQYTDQGDTLLRLNKPAEALAMYEKALALEESNTAAQLGQARSLRAMGQPEKAAPIYQTVIAGPTPPEVAFAEAVQLMLKLGESGSAETIARDLQKTDAERGGLLLAHVFRETQRDADAIVLLKELKTTYPESQNVRMAVASALAKDAKYGEAETELMPILETDGPQAIYARMMLVDIYQRQNRIDDLLKQLHQMVTQRPADDNLKLALARGLVAAGKIEEAEQTAHPVLEKTPESPWANYVMGVCLVAKGDYAHALECLQIAAAALPDVPEVATQLAAAQQGRSPIQDPATPQAGTSPEWQALWQSGRIRDLVLAADGANDSSAREAQTLAAVFFRNRSKANALAATLPADSKVKQYVDEIQKGDSETLVAFLDNWQESDKFRTVMKLNAEGFAYALIGARARALDRFAECAKANPDDAVALYNVAGMYRAAGMTQFAAHVLQQLIVRHPDNLEARELLFHALQDSGFNADARQSAEATFAVFPQAVSARVNLAQVYLRDGEGQVAIQVLESGLRDQPDNVMLKLALAEANLALGNIQAAKTQLAEVAAPPAAVAAAQRLTAMADALESGWDPAARTLESVPAVERDAASNLLLAAALLKLQRNDEIASVLDLVKSNEPSVAVARVACSKADDALADDESKLLADALRAQPDALHQYMFGLALRFARFNDQAMNAFQKADEALPGQPALVALLLSTVADNAQLQDRQSVAATYTERYPDMPAAWVGMAAVFRSIANIDEEEKALRKAVAIAPQYGPAWRRLADVMSTRSDASALTQVLKNLLEIYPDDPVVSNNLAYTLLQSGGDPAEAVALAQAAADTLGANPQVLHTLGLAHLKAGDIEQGKKELGIALQARPGDPTLLLDFGQALIAQNAVDEGKSQVRLAIAYAEQLGLEFPRRAEADALLSNP
ncbi:MAG: hypothetical protein AMXMBFR84_24250 [Candidatus Hydrogenedentota bacterium]